MRAEEMAFCPPTFPEQSPHWQAEALPLHFTASLASNCVHITNFCQCDINRSNVYHFQDRVFNNLLCLLHLFFPWFLPHTEDSEVLKKEPRDERIWAPESQVKVSHPLARTLALNCLGSMCDTPGIY